MQEHPHRNIQNVWPHTQVPCQPSWHTKLTITFSSPLVPVHFLSPASHHPILMLKLHNRLGHRLLLGWRPKSWACLIESLSLLWPQLVTFLLLPFPQSHWPLVASGIPQKGLCTIILVHDVLCVQNIPPPHFNELIPPHPAAFPFPLRLDQVTLALNSYSALYFIFMWQLSHIVNVPFCDVFINSYPLPTPQTVSSVRAEWYLWLAVASKEGHNMINTLKCFWNRWVFNLFIQEVFWALFFFMPELGPGCTKIKDRLFPQVWWGKIPSRTAISVHCLISTVRGNKNIKL